MNRKKHEAVLSNRAEMERAEKINCESCDEPVIFALRDSNGNLCSVNMSTILECMSLGIQRGMLPKLPLWWCHSVDTNYSSGLHCIPDVWYNDEKPPWMRE